MGEAVTDQDMLELHTRLLKAISMLLGGNPPEVQSSVLAELLAIWLGGWPEPLRQSLLESHMKAMADLLPHVEVNTPELIEKRTLKH
jgi:hypothetical protein